MSSNRLRQWIVTLSAALALVVAFVAFDRVFLSSQSSTSLAWDIPTVAENGDPIDNIAGYTIRCWGEGGQAIHTIQIDDPSMTRFEIDGLPSGRYQCAVSAYTDDGFESANSNFVARTVQ